MRLYRGTSAGLVSGAAILLATTSAFAQDDDVMLEAEADAEADVAAEEPVEEPMAEPEPEPEPEPMAEPEPLVEEPVDEEAVEEEAAAEDAEAVEEPGGLSWFMFGDAYASFQTAEPGTGTPGHRAYASSSPTFTNENGFSLSFIGLDVAYEGENWGVTTSLRFGPSVPIYYGPQPILDGFGAITNGYVSWAPADIVSLDFGLFGTIFGAEVAESWQNMNYTRGALYYLMQPFWHTGLRASIALSDEWSINAMVVNDANQVSLDPGSNVQGAVQIGYGGDAFAFALGTLQTIGEGNASGFDRFVDLVASYSAGDFSLLFNGDLNVPDNAEGFYGLSLAGAYQFVPSFGAALRAEFLDPGMDTSDDEFITGTLTLDLKPVPDSDNVVLRWDNRIEAGVGSGAASEQWFDMDGGASSAWFSSTVGLVAHTDGLL